MARIKDIKSDNPNYVIDLIDILATKDPTKTNKYLPFMVSQTKDWLDWFKEELEKNTFKEMFDIVKEFDELSQKKKEGMTHDFSWLNQIGEYGKMLYLLQDCAQEDLTEHLGFNAVVPVKTVYDILEERQNGSNNFLLYPSKLDLYAQCTLNILPSFVLYDRLFFLE